MDREITKRERKCLEIAFDALESGEYPLDQSWINKSTGKPEQLNNPFDVTTYRNGMAKLRVVQAGGNLNGTYHVTFVIPDPTHEVTVLISTHTNDGRMLNLHVDEESGELVELEIID